MRRPQLRTLLLVSGLSTIGLVLITTFTQNSIINDLNWQQQQLANEREPKFLARKTLNSKDDTDLGPIEKQAKSGNSRDSGQKSGNKYEVTGNNAVVSNNVPRKLPGTGKKGQSHCSKRFPDHGEVAIFIAVAADSLQRMYRVAHTFLWCYAEVQQYRVFVVDIYQDPLTFAACKMENVGRLAQFLMLIQASIVNTSQIFFRKHCAVSTWMNKYRNEYKWFAVLDADTAPVNHAHCLQEYMDNDVDIIFYERFYNFEVAAGNYMARNTPWTRQFLMDWANYEFTTTAFNFSAFDNGALQIHLLKTLQPQATTEHAMCELIWKKAFDYGSYLKYVTCVRYALGARKKWEHIKLYRRAHAWVIDWQITAGLWCKHSFMLHSWKTNDIPVTLGEQKWGTPFQRMPNTDECVPRYANGTLPKWPHRPEFKVSCSKLRDMFADGEISYAKDLPLTAKIMPYMEFPEISTCWPDCQ